SETTTLGGLFWIQGKKISTTAGEQEWPTAAYCRLIARQNHLPGSAHADRVVFERCAATEADLIILAMKAAVRPREAVRTEPSKNLLEECGHTRLATKRVE